MDTQKKLLPHMHPMMVHFPQALFPVAFASLLLYEVTGAPEFEAGTYIALLFGLLTIPVCVITGFVDWKIRYKGAMTRVFKIKIASSFMLLFFATPALLLRLHYPHLLSGSLMQGLGLLYLAMLTACAATCVILGYYGGKLVFH
jgi:uncharacterized membrane protein